METSLSLRRALGISAIVGFLVPVIFEVLFAILELGTPDSLDAFVTWRLCLWPTSIGLIGIGALPNWSFPALLIAFCSAVLNMPIYMAAGLLCWLAAKAVQRLSSRQRPNPSS
jgi:hypothetical protein